MTEAYEFMRLADVETAQEVQDTDTVLIIQGGTVKKAAKDNVGGGGSAAVYFVTSDNCFRTGTDWDAGEAVTVADVISAYKDGPVKIYQMYSGSFAGVGDVVGYRMYNGSECLMWVDPYNRSFEVNQ